MHCLVLLLATATATWAAPTAVAVDTQTGAYQDGKTLRVPMNETASEELLEKWLSQAVSGFMAALASRRLDQLSSDEREEVQVCSRSANSVPEHARCVVKILDNTKHVVTSVKDTPASHIKNKPYKKETKIQMKKKENHEIEWVGGFGQARAKRQAEYKVVNSDKYVMKNAMDETPMAQVARTLTKSIRKMKNKNGAEGWRETVLRVRKIGEKAKEDKEAREALKKRLKTMIDNSPKEYLDPRKPITMKQIELEEEELAMKQKVVKEKKDEVRVPLKLMREAIKVAMQLTGKNTTDFDNKTLKLFSPRLLSIVPEQEQNSLFNLLSPSLFSIHEDGDEEEKMFSLPQMLKNLNTKDQEAWLDFVVEASGVTDAVDKTEEEQKRRKEQEMRGEGGVPLFFTKENATEIGGVVEKQKIELFEILDKSYNPAQKEEMDKIGYSYLTDEQLDMVYGKDSPYHKESALKRFKQLRLKDDPHTHIEHDIRALAEAEKFKVRRKDIVSSPFLLTPLIGASTALSQPVILSPLVLSPIVLSPAVLGPIVLSPWVFIPLILSPRVLSPLILTPLVFSPIILSPLVLHPLILVPGVFNPLILSPLVLSPFILSPQVFTPLILSPMVLNPLILTPMVGSPLILSPFVLSPIILSPQALFAVVLSPYALSPLIESKLIASEVVLSPSWLS